MSRDQLDVMIDDLFLIQIVKAANEFRNEGEKMALMDQIRNPDAARHDTPCMGAEESFVEECVAEAERLFGLPLHLVMDEADAICGHEQRGYCQPRSIAQAFQDAVDRLSAALVMQRRHP